MRMPRLRKGGYLLACTAVILCTLATAQAGTKEDRWLLLREGSAGLPVFSSAGSRINSPDLFAGESDCSRQLRSCSPGRGCT